ncbi:MAG: sulfate ABC transporter ATP-binding protein [Candidatus Hydrogenedentes bacterium]|nr:sulfate ABC transporter ATP-binding protein [Candidatus Hydrogenedentota bacterium]
MSIQVRNVTKRFGRFTALHGIDLDVHSGELLALLGPSGSGKTTLLRIISGLDAPDTGSVILHGEDATRKNPRERRVGFVFQHYALFRHMTVFNNVGFGLRVLPRRRRPSKAEIRDRVFALLKLVQLENLADRYPAQLSGGQRQRVALARALAVEPKVLLLDEPFGALDAKVRKELRRWLRRLHDEIHVTSVFVTHDQEEALEVADRVVITNEGRIEQVGTPDEVYQHPANPFVYHFLGDVNLFHARIDGGAAHITGHPAAVHDGQSGADPDTTEAFVRPHLLELSIEPNGTNSFEATVAHVNPAGPFVKVELISKWGVPLQANVSQECYRALQLRRDLRVFVVPKEIRTFADTKRAEP